jgi:transcriptional antiterminator NusG
MMEGGGTVMTIYTVKTVVGRENIVIDSISSKAVSEILDVKALVHPEEIKGYVFIEGAIRDVEKVLQMVPHIRGVIKKPIAITEIQRFLQPKKVEIDLKVKDIVEVIGGPFKGERGKVTRYDKAKREVIIELLDVTVPIPITVNAEFVKLSERSRS